MVRADEGHAAGGLHRQGLGCAGGRREARIHSHAHRTDAIMWQAIWALVGAAATVAGCYVTGALLIDWAKAPLKRPERFPLAFVLGASMLHLAVFTVLSLKIAYRPVVVALV